MLFLTGWSESMMKYGDLFEELCENGITIVAMDHRSQGLSGRAKRTSNEQQYETIKSHVEDFHDHVTDALMVINQIIAPTANNNKGNGRFFIMGFSMGGLVAAQVATLVKCSGLVLVAPCLRPNTGNIPASLVHLLTHSLRLMGKGEEFIPGHPYGFDHRMLMPPHSRVSSSSARIKFWERMRFEQKELCINGMSVAHLNALLSANFSLNQADQLLAKRVLTVSAELDVFVDNEAIFELSDAISDKLPCRHVHIQGAKHEVLHEREEIRSHIVSEILSFVMW